MFGKKQIVSMAMGLFPPEKIRGMVAANVDPILNQLEKFVDGIELEEGETEISLLLRKGVDKRQRKTIHAFPVSLNGAGEIQRVIKRFDLRSQLENLPIEDYMKQIKDSM